MQKGTDYKEIVKKLRREQRAQREMTPEEHIAIFDQMLASWESGIPLGYRVAERKTAKS